MFAKPPAYVGDEVSCEVDGLMLTASLQPDWTYVGVVVTASRDGVELAEASLWGIESDAESYILEVANDLIPEAINESLKTIKQLASIL